MDSVDVADRLAALLNEAREAGYCIWESEYDPEFYISPPDYGSAFAIVRRESAPDGKWINVVPPP